LVVVVSLCPQHFAITLTEKAVEPVTVVSILAEVCVRVVAVIVLPPDASAGLGVVILHRSMGPSSGDIGRQR